ncbi:MAG: serine protease [Thermoanaerobaculia bacterium]
MRQPSAARLLAFVALAALLPRASAWAADEVETLELGRTVSSSIDWEAQRWKSFRVNVPEDAMVLTIKLEGAPIDLDLFARHGSPLVDYQEDAEHEAVSDRYNEALRISRSSEPPLEPGFYYIDVVYNLETEARIGKKRAHELPFSLTASVIRARVDDKLGPAGKALGETGQDNGWFRTYTIDVPEGARVLRLDLDDVAGDLDLVARRGGPILERKPTDHAAESVLGRETLVIDRSSDPPLRPGTWYINVFDPFELDPVRFTLYARFDPEPPPELLVIPAIRAPTDGLDRAVLSTVEILTEGATGSGTLVSAAGWVLTNYHVIESDSGGVLGPGQLVIGLCLDSRRPTVELFRGSVALFDQDLDLALVHIETGLYGQALPTGYRFPYLEPGKPESQRIGDAITILGFPSVGGLGSRASITLTRGVVSGFDTTAHGVVFKTDAEIASGNSGGAALDASFRLIGVPTGSVEDKEGYSHLGYILPISLIPQSWRDRIGW